MFVNPNSCVLCSSHHISLFLKQTYKKGRTRLFYRCSDCELIFIHPELTLKIEEQKSFYKNHNNSPLDLGYIDHLSQILTPLLKRIETHHVGLDFGCGPGPTLHTLFKEKGIHQENFDPLFFPHTHLLNQKYDFVTATEVVEHFTEPAQDWRCFKNLLKPLGILAIMTQFQPQLSDFENWWYHRDITHVSFYTPQTLKWIAHHFGYELLYCTHPVALFQKSSP